MTESNAPAREPEEDDPSPVEEAAGERLGIERWDRPMIFRETAEAAVDNGLPYWLVLVLSGAIATLGLALDSSAVVIGAMLVAPLLAPIVGLSLGLAVGDARLALQTATVVGVSLVTVVVTAAGLTALLPFHTLTLEISARIHPTTLDLGVAVCSGLVGALVTVARGHRLSAAIPGVAVAVALIPPLAVAGFGVGAGWQTEVIWGSLLLLGANLAGIVLSGVLVFLLIGMHRADVVEEARRYHEDARPGGVAGLACRVPGVGRARVFGSAFGRAALVLVFVVALAIPLTAALKEVVREARVRAAVEAALELLEVDGTTSVLGQRVELAPDTAVARVRVATAVGVSRATRDAFRRLASERAGEPVHLRLEQLPAGAGNMAALQALLRGGDGPTEDVAWPETLARARTLLEDATWSLPFPEGAEAVAVVLRLGDGEGPGPSDSVVVAYLAPEPLTQQAAEILGGVLRRAVGHPELGTSFERVGPSLLALAPGDTVGLGNVLALLVRHPGLTVSVRSAAGDSVQGSEIVDALRSAGAASIQLQRRPGPGPLEIRIRRGGG